MLIVKLEAGETGARGNQVIYPALEEIPEGWAEVPQELEAEALEFLPWMTLEVRDGKITGIGDNAEARAAAQARAALEAGQADGAGEHSGEKD